MSKSQGADMDSARTDRSADRSADRPDRGRSGPPAPALGVRVAGSRLRVGAFTRAGDGVTMVQADQTTCGATCLLAARLLLDSQERHRLGRALAAPRTPAASAPGAAPLRNDPAGQAGARLLAILGRRQQALQRAINRTGLGPLPWPRALGSTPWSVARAMSAPAAGASPGQRARYRVRWVRDRGPSWADEVEGVRRHLARGLPVLLLTGGPLALGWGTGAIPARLVGSLALPRHYVLALPWALIGRADPGAGRVHLYEPGRGSVRALDLLAAGGSQGPAPSGLGGWPRVMALIAPSSPSESR